LTFFSGLFELSGHQHGGAWLRLQLRQYFISALSLVPFLPFSPGIVVLFFVFPDDFFLRLGSLMLFFALLDV